MNPCLVTELVHRCGYLQVRGDDRRSLETQPRRILAALAGAGVGGGRQTAVHHVSACWAAKEKKRVEVINQRGIERQGEAEKDNCRKRKKGIPEGCLQRAKRTWRREQAVSGGGSQIRISQWDSILPAETHPADRRSQ